MDKQNAVVYCTDNQKKYRDMMVASIQGIRHFNKSIPIKILTSYDMEDKLLSNLQVEIIKSSPIFSKFPADKCIAGRINAKNILLLDADTFVLGNVEPIFELSKADVSARLSYRYSQNWEEKYDRLWKANNAKLNIGKADIINSGVVVFRNNAHKKIFDTWVSIIKKFYQKEISEVYSGEWMFEQIALSMSIAKLGLKLHILDKRFHTFGWDEKEFDTKNSIVMHTNCSKHRELKRKLIKQKRMKI